MIDRVPINILANGAIKQNVYDEAGILLRSEYVKRDDGAIVTGTPLDKAHLLADAVKALLWPSGSVPADPSINDVFNRLSAGMLFDNGAVKNMLGQLVTLPVSQLDNPVHIATGSYTGTGTFGAANPCVLPFPFSPKVLTVYKNWFLPDASAQNSTSTAQAVTLMMGGLSIGTRTQRYVLNNNVYLYLKLTNSGKTVAWDHDTNANSQLNSSGEIYYYTAMG